MIYEEEDDEVNTNAFSNPFLAHVRHAFII
jgi:hypothetical protein